MKQKRDKKGGFIPSVGEPFSLLAGKYITPLALYSGYRLIRNMNKKTLKRDRYRTKHKKRNNTRKGKQRMRKL